MRIYIFDGGIMQDDIFGLLLMILMLENGGGTESINQLILMFLMMNSKNGSLGGSGDGRSRRHCDAFCGREDGFTF